MPTPSSTASFTTPIASTSPARASDADAPDRAQRIDDQPTTLPKIYCQQGARQPGDIISYRRKSTASRAPANQATSSRIAGRDHLGISGRLRRNLQTVAPGRARPALARETLDFKLLLQ